MEAVVHSLVIDKFQKLASAIKHFSVSCAVETSKLTVRLIQCVSNITRHVKRLAPLDTCEISVPLAIRTTNTLATLVESNLYLEE